MNLREDLTLIEVEYKDKSALLTFLDEDCGEIREVKFNKQVWDNGSYVDDADKEKMVEEWCQKYFEVSFDNLSQAVGVKKDVYCYDGFNSLWECNTVSKFSKDNVGEIFTTEIKEVIDDGKGIHITFEYNGSTYESKMMYAKYVEVRKEWFPDPQKKNKRYGDFKKKFGVSVEDAEEIVGNEIMVEVKLAMGKYPWCDIKKPKWNK